MFGGAEIQPTVSILYLMIAMMLLDLFQVVGEDIETNFLFLCRHIAPQCRHRPRAEGGRIRDPVRQSTGMISRIYQLEL